ncbi:MAG TPA: carbohydrate porin [Syntrophales bacterium]|nr:carbohydrate porin [Syntrophales bacterium]
MMEHTFQATKQWHKSLPSRMFFLICCLFLLFPGGLWAQEASEVERLKDQIEILKQKNAEQIQLLEQRLKALEENTAKARQEVETVREKLTGTEEQLAKTREDVKKVDSKPLPDSLTKGFEFHGYLRSGAGVSGNGSAQAAFQAPGAGGKYRLGNETDTYGEILLVNNFNPGQKSPFFKVNLRLAYSTDWNHGGDTARDTINVRESYIEMGGFDFAKTMSFWAGQRFYRRMDIHMIDFWLLDMSGYGGGIEGIPTGLGNSRLAVAYFGGTADNYQFSTDSRVNKHTLDIRLYDIDVPFGKGTILFAPSTVYGTTYQDTNGNTFACPSTSGFMAGLFHEAVAGGGSTNRATVMYGRGTGSDFSPVLRSPTATLGDAWQFRATESPVIRINDRLSLQGALVFQAKDTGDPSASRTYWYSAGVRPIYSFSKHFALALEAGVDWVDNRIEDYSDALFKVTLAPELRIDTDFFARPVLRVFATYAAWGSGLKDRVGGTTYLGETSGFTAGVQGEVWW